MYVLAPASKQWEPWGTLCRFITDRGIDANAYFYTENDEFFEAHRALTNKMKYEVDGFTAEEGF